MSNEHEEAKGPGRPPELGRLLATIAADLVQAGAKPRQAAQAALDTFKGHFEVPAGTPPSKALKERRPFRNPSVESVMRVARDIVIGDAARMEYSPSLHRQAVLSLSKVLAAQALTARQLAIKRAVELWKRNEARLPRATLAQRIRYVSAALDCQERTARSYLQDGGVLGLN